VDNGSTDSTTNYLQDYVAEHKNVRVVLNASNHGFAAGNNQGLALARGDSVVLLNNDTVVTEGWLGRMLAIFDRYPEVGIVGPVSNHVTGTQQVANVPYQTLEEMHEFAAKWATEHAGKSTEINRIVAFCLLMRRAVIKRIGGLDEQFLIGNFEDDDFCHRAGLAGFKARIAKDVFIHHTGGQTFQGAGIDHRKSMERNWRLFKTKWDIPAQVPLGQGYYIPHQTPDVARYFIPLSVERVLADHEPDGAQRLWRDAALFSQIPRLLICFIRKDTDMDAARAAFQRFTAHLSVSSDCHVKSVSEISERLGKSQFLVLLSPDVIFTKHWLDNLIAVAESDSSIAAVGPTSNAAPVPQKVKMGYRSLKKGLQKFANRKARKFKQSWGVVPYLGAFCLLLKNEAVRQVDGLDVGLSLPDALWDLYARLRMKGFKLACARGVYVHHRELTEDEGRNYDHWAVGEEAVVGEPILTETSPALEESRNVSSRGQPGDSITIPRPGALSHTPKLSVCMIVRDEEKIVLQCLKTVRSIADELIIVDTGSQDDTISIVKSFGAKVFYFKWCDDFSAARNEALKYATGDWIFHIDADEELLPSSIHVLKKRIFNAHCLVYMITIDNGPTYTERFFKSGRLFRNHPQIRYSRPYHETIRPSADSLVILETGWRIIYEPKILVRHYGYEKSRIKERSKLERELRILKAYMRDNPHDQSMAIRLAEVNNHAGRHDEAARICKRALKTNPDYAAAYHILGTAYCGQGMLDNAIIQFKKALAIDPDVPWIRYHLGAAYSDKGNLDEAVVELKRALAIDSNLGEAHNSLGVVFHKKGMLEEALEAYQHALRINPSDAEAHFNLGIVYRNKGMLDEAIREYKKALASDPQLAEAHNNLAIAYYMKGQYRMAVKHCDKAIELGLKVHPRFLQDLRSHMK